MPCNAVDNELSFSIVNELYLDHAVNKHNLCLLVCGIDKHLCCVFFCNEDTYKENQPDGGFFSRNNAFSGHS